MNLSKSSHMGRSQRQIKNRSAGRLGYFDSQQKIYQQYLSPSQIVTMTIKMRKNDQLEPSFVDDFSRFISNNSNFDLYNLYGGVKETTFLQFSQIIRNLTHQMNRSQPFRDYHQKIQGANSEEKAGFKKTKSYESLQSIRKESGDMLSPCQNQYDKKRYVFSFEADSNSIILLLDLSSYMLLYDYSTKSFLIQNMQQIVKDFFNQLEHHYKERKNGEGGPSYFVSCYAFSVYCKEIQEVLKNQEVHFSDNHENKFKNWDLISDYICSYIHKSSLSHILKNQKNAMSISKIIQKVLNLQQGHSGIKSFITISAFREVDTTPYVFFSSNWYTYCFICPGELNFGSFLIDDSEVANRFFKNPYLVTKFVFKCKFLQNWEKVQLIERQGFQFKYLDSNVQKSRAILYISSNGQKKQSIFDDILKFNLKLEDKRKRNETFYKSTQSVATVPKGLRILTNFQYTVAEQYIMQVLRTKYLQGWEPVNKQIYLQNTKYFFKLEFPNRSVLQYNAQRIEDRFKVKFSYAFPQNEQIIETDVQKNERDQIIETIKKIDLINISNFDIVTSFKNKSQLKGEKQKKQKSYKFCLNFDSMSSQGATILQELLKKHDEWNSYFKVRKIYLKFTPNTDFKKDLDQALNQFGYLLGQRICYYQFMQRRQKKERLTDSIKQKQISKWNVIFVKVSGVLQFLQFKFGFLKFNDAQIKQTIQNIENKLISKKLMNGSINIVSQDVYNYCIERFNHFTSIRKKIPEIFQKVWKIKFKSKQLCRVYRYLNGKTIKKLGYSQLYLKSSTSYYYRSILLGQKQQQKQKGIFLQISLISSSIVQFKLQTFPSFDFFHNPSHRDLSSSEVLSTQKSIPNLTSKSISSMTSNQMSTSLSSLPLPLLQNQSKDSICKNQNKCKNSFLELFNYFIEEVKQSQKRLINILKCYVDIYEVLIKKKIEQKKSGVENKELMLKIIQIYNMSEYNFEGQYLEYLQKCKKQSYGEQIQQTQKGRRYQKISVPQNQMTYPQINIDHIPEPIDFLIQIQVTTIKGDLMLTCKNNPQKKYTFFLITPDQIVYLWKKPWTNKIYYRCFYNIYCNFRTVTSFEGSMKQIIEKQIIRRIKKQPFK